MLSPIDGGSPAFGEMKESSLDARGKNTDPNQSNRHKITVSISHIRRPPGIKRISLPSAFKPTKQVPIHSFTEMREMGREKVGGGCYGSDTAQIPQPRNKR
jgi:hypothetical protein